MTIGIIAAMEEEIFLLRNQIKSCKAIFFGSNKIYTGQLKGMKVALLKSGIGKVASSFRSTILIEYCKPNIIINTGSAGSLITTLNIGDIVISSEMRYHDVDVTAFGYEFGQIPGFPPSFKADKNLLKSVKKCIKNLNLNAIYGLTLSGDTFIKNSLDRKRICEKFPKAIAVEMESTAIAHVCYNFGIPFIAVRAISDVAGQQSHIIFDKFLDIAVEKYTLIIQELIQKLKVK